MSQMSHVLRSEDNFIENNIIHAFTNTVLIMLELFIKQGKKLLNTTKLMDEGVEQKEEGWPKIDSAIFDR